MLILAERTPIEEYEVRNVRVQVKREDLSSRPPAPRLAKLRGVHKYMEKLKTADVALLGVFDTWVSKSGWGCAAIANEIGNMRVVNYYPDLVRYDGDPPENQLNVLDLGHEIRGLPGGRTAILYAKAKREIEAEGGHMMPMGLTVVESVWATRKIAIELVGSSEVGDLVVCCGSGMITAGLYAGLRHAIKGRIYSISAGMSLHRQAKRIAQTLGSDCWRSKVCHIIPDGVDYYDAEPTDDIPFPTSPYYDAKAWRWLEANIQSLLEPVFFWNIGV